MTTVDPIALLAARVANDPEPSWRLVLARVRDSNARDVAAALLPIVDALDDARDAANAFSKARSTNANNVVVKPGTTSERSKVDVSRALAVARLVSFSAPRGKFDVHIMPNGGIVLENAKGTVVEVAPGDVRRVLELPTRDANGTTYVCVSVRGDGAGNGKLKANALCAAFRAKDKLVIDGEGLAFEDGEGERPNAARMFYKALERGVGAAACGTVDPVKVFAGAKGYGHVQATNGFNSGYLFFLKEGVAFGQSPAMYLHFDELEDLRILRADNAGSSSFDLSMTPMNGAKIEFSNISRDELDHVRRYLAKRCTSAEDAEAGTGAANASRESDDDDSDDDDEDFTGHERDSDADDDDENDGEDDDDDDDDENEMDYSCDDSDDVHGEGDATRKRLRIDDASDSDVEPLRGPRGRAAAQPKKTPAVAVADSSDVSEDDDDDEDSGSESDDNAFQVIAQR